MSFTRSTNSASAHRPFVLILIKKSYTYGEGAYAVTSGLRVSAEFTLDLLLQEGYKARLEEAVDGNCIDRFVTHYRPAHVILEALWVTPDKLAELVRLHPLVKWTVRVHSELPFLANEGNAIDWLKAYVQLGVEVAFNSKQTVEDFEAVGDSVYLPNYYPLRHRARKRREDDGVLHIGCFGAIRPLKNQLIQAFAAVEYARRMGRKLVFHMNGSRLEQFGESNLRNIRALFEGTDNILLLHPWLEHKKFLELLEEMDICLQVSLSESFNVTSADAISMSIPLVGSEAIAWLPKRSKAKVDNVANIVATMAHADTSAVLMNHAALGAYLEASKEAWRKWLTAR
jgi:glycosyltransferase involved in cell wall biosynthesis